MKITEVKYAQSKPNLHGVDVRNMSETKNAQVAHITLKPGESLKKHITPVDVVFYVLKGREQWRSAKREKSGTRYSD